MKKILILALCLSMVVMTSCGKQKTQVNNEAEQNQTEVAPIEHGSVGAVEEDGKVKVTMPENAFGGKSAEMAQKIKDNRGFEAAEVAEDGSVTFTMTKEQHKTWLLETAENVRNEALKLVSDNNYISIKEININDDFTEAEIKVNKKAFEKSQDESISNALANNMFTYQSCNGVVKENLKALVKFIDEETGEEVAVADITANN